MVFRLPTVCSALGRTRRNTPIRLRRPQHASKAGEVRRSYCTQNRGTSQERSSWPARRRTRAFPDPICQRGRERSFAQRMRRPTVSAPNHALAVRLLSSHAPSSPEHASRLDDPSHRASDVDESERPYPFRVWRRLPATAARDIHKTRCPIAFASEPAIAFISRPPTGSANRFRIQRRMNPG